MKRLAKMFDREQAGFDIPQCLVFLLGTAALMSIFFEPFGQPPSAAILTFLYTFGVATLFLDLLYVSASVVCVRGRHSQYVYYFVLILYEMLLLFVMLPSLAVA